MTATDQIIEVDEHGGVSVAGEGPGAELLAAHLGDERLRSWAAELLGRTSVSADLRQRGNLLLSAPPPSLAELRELVAAAGSMEIRRDTVTTTAEPAVRRLKGAAAAVLAAHPYLNRKD